ncbi:MAG: hypothetical protein ACR2OM_07245 [Aestuariivirgaceae bacterium]
MKSVTTLLLMARDYGRLVLIAGLVAGIALPDLALAMKPWLGEMVAALLFVSALRIGPAAAAGRLADLARTFNLVAVTQLTLPLVFAGVFVAVGFSGPLAVAFVLMLAAPSIVGSPNLTLMTGNDPAPALRLLIAGTALMPLTVVPVFWLSPAFGTITAVIAAAARLLVIITVAGGLAFFIRHRWFRNPASRTLNAIDGLSAIMLAIVVIGLMAAVGPALRDEPLRLAGMLAIVFAANFGLQFVAWFALHRVRSAGERVSWSIVSGNRNMGLFLAALPASVTDPILLYIGCYQIPMFLTPVMLGWLYRPRPGPDRQT